MVDGMGGDTLEAAGRMRFAVQAEDLPGIDRAIKQRLAQLTGIGNYRFAYTVDVHANHEIRGDGRTFGVIWEADVEGTYREIRAPSE